MNSALFSSGQTDGLSRSGVATMNQRLNSRNQQLAKAKAAGGLASQLAANPIGSRVQASPLRQALQQRRQQSSNNMRTIQGDFARDAAAQQNPLLNGARMANDRAGQMQSHLARAAGVGQAAASGAGYTDQYNITTRNGVGTAGPSMGNQSAIDAAYARRAAASAARPTARIGLGSDGQRMVAQGTPLSRMFPSASDESNRAKFEAARDARAERKAEARAMRQDQLAQQRQAAMAQQGQTQVINPFMNPIAMEAMRRQPELALGAVSSLNEAIQGRGRLQTARAATVADQQYRQQDLGLRGALGMGRLDLDRQGMESENKYRGSQADAAMRTADANYMSAEAQAARARAEADAISNPANRQFQNQMDLFAAAAGVPGMEGEVRDLFEAMRVPRSDNRLPDGPLGPVTPRAPLTPAPAIRIEPDPMTGDVAPEQLGALMGELVNGQQLQGEDLMSALERSGVTRNQAEQYFVDGAPGLPTRTVDTVRRWLGGATTDRGLDRKYRPFVNLAGALGIDY